jgi:hypothetical protein
MESGTQKALTNGRAAWAGRIVSGVVVLFLLFDSGIKLMQLAAAVQGTTQLGYREQDVFTMGLILLVSVILYAIPRTAVLGAILLTGYLGGAVAAQLRVGNPIFTHTLFPVYVGLLLWGGLFLRDARLRALVPLRS